MDPDSEDTKLIKQKLEKLYKFSEFQNISDLKGKVETIFLSTHFCNRVTEREKDGDAHRMEIIRGHDQNQENNLKKL